MPVITTPQTKVDQYLIELRTRLRSLPDEQAMDIVEEIRSQIHDTAGSDGEMTDASVNAALNRLGPASALAANYVTDNFLEHAQRDRMPWTLLRGVFRWAMMSVQGFLVFILCVIGYGFGASFLIAALAKPFNPKAGLWLIAPGSYSLTLGMTNSMPPGHELLGWKLVPVGLSLGGGTILLTTYFGQWCIRRFRRTRRIRSEAAVRYTKGA
jgi:hypothetical protein